MLDATASLSDFGLRYLISFGNSPFDSGRELAFPWGFVIYPWSFSRRFLFLLAQQNGKYLSCFRPSPMQTEGTLSGLGVVILAAGGSTRMERPKLLLPWRKTTIIGHLLQQWQDLGALQIAVVCAGDDNSMPAELDRLGFPTTNRITNPEPARGMFSSVQCAAAWKGWRREITGWAIVLGDQPHVSRQTLRTLLEFQAHNPGKICQPAYAGRPKHPVILPRQYFDQLAQSPKSTLREFLQSYPAALASVALADPGLALDLDTPADYALAVKLYSQRL
jgi:molybdenum cofactor cytidylyltransferase